MQDSLGGNVSRLDISVAHKINLEIFHAFLKRHLLKGKEACHELALRFLCTKAWVPVKPPIVDTLGTHPFMQCMILLDCPLECPLLEAPL